MVDRETENTAMTIPKVRAERPEPCSNAAGWDLMERRPSGDT